MIILQFHKWITGNAQFRGVNMHCTAERSFRVFYRVNLFVRKAVTLRVSACVTTRASKLDPQYALNESVKILSSSTR